MITGEKMQSNREEVKRKSIELTSFVISSTPHTPLRLLPRLVPNSKNLLGSSVLVSRLIGDSG